ncbi:MAG: response regulator transcription factor [Acidobacteriota bacterium]
MTEVQRLLVVDDDVDTARTAADILRRAGYQVETASSGKEALRRVERTLYDLVLLDINMPGMNGWELLKMLKADDATAGMPVAMFTVRGEVRDKVHGLQEGAFDYITKPFGVDELRERVATILRKRGAARVVS